MHRPPDLSRYCQIRLIYIRVSDEREQMNNEADQIHKKRSVISHNSILNSGSIKIRKLRRQVLFLRLPHSLLDLAVQLVQVLGDLIDQLQFLFLQQAFLVQGQLLQVAVAAHQVGAGRVSEIELF